MPPEDIITKLMFPKREKGKQASHVVTRSVARKKLWSLDELREMWAEEERLIEGLRGAIELFPRLAEVLIDPGGSAMVPVGGYMPDIRIPSDPISNLGRLIDAWQTITT